MTSREFRARVTRRARRFELTPSSDQLESLEAYYRLLVRWNAKINLTALRLEPLDESGLDRLLIEPLIAVKFLPTAAVRLMDVGSGSGSPVIPIGILRRDLALTLVESKTRKAVFLMEAVRELALNAAVESARFEQLLARPDLHESMNALTIRAVRIDARILMSLQAFLKPEGQMLWFRSTTSPAAPSVPPPLRWGGTQTLIEASGSRLVLLTKDAVGGSRMFHVEHS